ncbi:solute carrier family 45 member 3-like [Bombina bombina]|uniref:solute carrier family 45 member 3-like n=1 Tax=Bombina bombina TaxID=8345 RepID=UPI00235AFFCC|nr:solute carrier family 45 member 3-like [Bombina bombina]
MTSCNLQWHLVLLNFMTCGLEICIAAGITYVPPLLLEAGVEEQYMTMVLGIGPVLGLIFVPLIGSASDNCQSSYGRRRPFLWFLSLGVLFSLFIIPHADLLASYFTYREKGAHIFFLILGVGLLDCCVQFCFTPLEALLSDLYHDDEGCSQAFAMFSFMISIGGCIGYLMTSVNWNYTYMSLYLGGQDECLFLMLSIIFIISVLVTMKTSEEPVYGPPQIVERKSIASISFSKCCCIPKWKTRSWKCSPLFCLLSLCWSITPRIYHSYCRIPTVIKHLCAAQLCSWMAVMSFMLFYTDFVGEGLYKGIPSAAPGTESRLRYDEGIRMGSLGLFLQGATSTFFSVIMNKLTKHFGSRNIYIASMVTFTSSAFVICLSQNIVIVTIMSSLTGFAYATLQTLPYTLICMYHTEKDIFMPRAVECKRPDGNTLTKEAVYFAPNIAVCQSDGGKEERVFIPQELESYIHFQEHQYYSNNNCKQTLDKKETCKDTYSKRGIGLDFATLDSAFLLSQVFPSLCMGMIVQFMQSVTVYIASSVIFGIFAIYLANRIVFDQKDLHS